MFKHIYKKIQSEYDKRRTDAQKELDEKTRKLFEKIPELEDLDVKIKKTGLKYSRLILEKPEGFEDLSGKLEKEIDDLKQEWEDLLLANGYTRDYLSLSHVCSECKDTGYIEKDGVIDKCICFKRQLIEYMFDQSNIMRRSGCGFEFFKEELYSDNVDVERFNIDISPRENIKRIKDRCIRFVENFDDPNEKNIFFVGPTGIGKTFMSNCIAVELLNRGRTVLYLTAQGLFDVINKYKCRENGSEDYADDYYNSIFDVELLIIDDLGTESMTAARYSELLNILSTRELANHKRTCKMIISTNVDIKKIHEYYDERIFSRIIGNFNIYQFFGDDIRKLLKT